MIYQKKYILKTFLPPLLYQIDCRTASTLSRRRMEAPLKSGYTLHEEIAKIFNDIPDFSFRRKLTRKKSSKSLYTFNVLKEKLNDGKKDDALNLRKKSFPIEKMRHNIIINSSLSNCIITITNSQNNVVRSFSCGSVGFSKAKRSTYYAAVQTGSQAATFIKNQLKAKSFTIFIKGFGYAKKAALKGLRQLIKFSTIIDQYLYGFSIPHNGCRPKKRKRR